MSQNKPPKKKVVTTKGKSKTPKKVVTTSAKKTKTVSTSTTKSSSKSKIAKPKYQSRKTKKAPAELIFKKGNYLLMGAGLGLIILGLLLMSGGRMPNPDVWDDTIIYSFRRITLAPILILAGLVVEIVAIFKRF